MRYLTGQPYNVPFRVLQYDDGYYAVFDNEHEAADFAALVLGRPDAQISNFNGFCNGVLLQDGECEE